MKSLKHVKSVRFFSNGEEALKELHKQVEQSSKPPDVILLDINMPVMDGWEFLENYAAIPLQFRKDIKMVLSSSTIDADEINRARIHPDINFFIQKPIDTEAVNNLML